LVALGLTIEQRRALQLLADAPNGYTDAALRARGFTPTLLVELAAYGYVVERPETMKAAGKTFGFMRFAIGLVIRFLSIGPRFCSTLLSDLASRRRPCASLTLRHHQAG
jgi:hypothetical protein